MHICIHSYINILLNSLCPFKVHFNNIGSSQSQFFILAIWSVSSKMPQYINTSRFITFRANKCTQYVRVTIISHKITDSYILHSLLAHYHGTLNTSRTQSATAIVQNSICYVQGGSNMTGTDLYVNKPHCAAAVRPWESEATTSTLPPARVITCSVLSGSC